jgi:hypothetical protein
MLEAEETGMEMAEGDGEEGLEDRVVDLEDKLDELMAEFEALMGGDEGEEEVSDTEIDLDAGEGGDALEMDDTEEFTDEEPGMMEEAVNLQAAPKPVTSEEGGTNTKSVNANNSGAVGAMAQPVKMTGDTAKQCRRTQASDNTGRRRKHKISSIRDYGSLSTRTLDILTSAGTTAE